MNNALRILALIECIDRLRSALNCAGKERRLVVFLSGCRPCLFDDAPARLAIGLDETPHDTMTAFGVGPDRHEGLVLGGDKTAACCLVGVDIE